MEPNNPEFNDSETNKYVALSQWCIQQADEYLAQENNIQASEKGWGATAHALKAIAEERGWNHRNNGLIIDIAQQIADEQGQPDLFNLFGSAQALHINFYEDWLDSDNVRIYLDAVESLLPELERARAATPPPFSPANRPQRQRWQRLTREVT